MTNLSRRSFTKLFALPAIASIARIANAGENARQALPNDEGDEPAQEYYGGWIPDPGREFIEWYVPPPNIIGSLRPSLDVIRHQMSAPYYQGKINSCVANALAGMIEYLQRKTGFKPSRLFLYNTGRLVANGGDANALLSDNGLGLEPALGALAGCGVCPEADWKYDPRPVDPNSHKFPKNYPAATNPSRSAYNDAKNHIFKHPLPIKANILHLKACLAEGFPFLFGFHLYPSFFDPPGLKGKPKCVVPVPTEQETTADDLLKHYVLAVGYKNDKQDANKGYFICRNSWGTGVQENGYFYMPYDYVMSSLSDDFYTFKPKEATE